MLKFSNMTTPQFKQKVQVVTISENEVLLLQFAKFHDEGFQNITGSVEYDESFVEAARREMLEEIGVADNVTDIHMTFHFHNRWGDDVEEKVFLYNPQKKPSIVISEEHQSYKWIAVSQVQKEDFKFPTNYEAFLKAMEFVK
jgi:8-oxo-dGTP pyrophosphatase MutT (NUDIX family)